MDGAVSKNQQQVVRRIIPPNQNSLLELTQNGVEFRWAFEID